MIRIFTNEDIYNYWEMYSKVDFSSVYIPVKINFYIQKNFLELKSKYSVIADLRNKIVEQYGDFSSENGCYTFSKENLEKANKELDNLQSIKQELEIKEIALKDLEDVELSTEQLQSLMFMIVE